MKKFTYASAFAGIGGMTLGLKQLGGEGVIAWEYDPTQKKSQPAQEAHKLLHPEIPIQGNICDVDTDIIPSFDVLCFTPPCQAFSTAGKRGGFEDTRGTLTFEALRIAKDKKPKILFMENVKGLVNHDKGNTMSTILHAINEIGYTVDFTVLNSKYFDVAQNRERVYLIAIRDDLIESESWNDIKGTKMLPKAKKRYQAEGVRTFNFDWPQQLEVKTKLLDFLEDKVDEKYYLSDKELSPLIVPFDEDVEGLGIREATVKGYAIAEEGDSVNVKFPDSKTRRGRVGKQIANTIEAVYGAQCVLESVKFELSEEIRGIVAKSRPNEKEIGITFNTNGDIRPHRLDAKKSGISELNINHENNPSFTITASHAPKIYGETTSYRIRKLTPRECLRLQSVPEDSIDILLENFSESRCYKFAGNGLTTNVIKAIGEKLVKYL